VLAKTVSDHNTELGSVDIKVRKALKSRDDAIQSLKEQLSRAERIKNESERVLAELNAGISAVVRPKR
jgi:hypothetical protein